MPSALLSTVRAQPTAIEMLRRALARGRVHHAYLFDGPDGVGKERAAFGLAQALVCERRPAYSADACGNCRACVRSIPRAGAATPLHPDVVLLARALYEPSAIGRRAAESQDVSIDQIRTLVLSRAAFPPHEGKAKVFILRAAEELSVPAASALLKTLEEPGTHTYFILLSSAGDSLLTTIRSRTLRVRFGILPDDVIADLLVTTGIEQDQAAAIARLAGGSMAAATLLSDPARAEERHRFVVRAMSAIEASSLADALVLAEEAKKISKDALLLDIRALAAAFAALGRIAGAAAEVAASRYTLALSAAAQIESNASVQLAVEAMFIKMRAA